MYLPTTHDGMKSAIAWCLAARIVGQFDAGVVQARQMRAQGIRPDPFADKPKGVRMTAQGAIDAVVARVRARNGQI